MANGELIYLDNAATGYPKPQRVVDRVREFMQNDGGNAGRGSHELAMRAAQTVFECRSRLAELFDADSPERVCFALNTTQALNTCIKGILKKGDHVLISDIEHNAVYRPVYKLYSSGIIEYDLFPSLVLDPERSAERICKGIEARVKRNTKMLICTGASNICSATMPLFEIGRLCRRLGIIFAVDGAQCAGHLPISLKKMNIDILCLPGHKGLFGPQGCGVMMLGRELQMNTLIEGGNGVDSLDGSMSYDIPERYEAGTLPLAAIAGLSAGLEVLRTIGIDRICEHERKLFCRACEQLGEIKGIRLYASQHEGAVLLFNIDGKGSEESARRLGDQGICVRGGYHCCALGHKTLGSDTGGVRVSFGPFNSSDDVDALCRAVKDTVS